MRLGTVTLGAGRALRSQPRGARKPSLCHSERKRRRGKFGREGYVELAAIDLHFAQHAFWSGGETQVYADAPTHSYVVYDRMVRTGFDAEGHNRSEMAEGLVVQTEGRTVLSIQCALPKPFDEQTAVFDQRLIEKLVPEGEYVPH